MRTEQLVNPRSRKAIQFLKNANRACIMLHIRQQHSGTLMHQLRSGASTLGPCQGPQSSLLDLPHSQPVGRCQVHHPQTYGPGGQDAASCARTTARFELSLADGEPEFYHEAIRARCPPYGASLTPKCVTTSEGHKACVCVCVCALRR